MRHLEALRETLKTIAQNEAEIDVMIRKLKGGEKQCG